MRVCLAHVQTLSQLIFMCLLGFCAYPDVSSAQSVNTWTRGKPQERHFNITLVVVSQGDNVHCYILDQTCVVSIWTTERLNGFHIVKMATLTLAHIDFVHAFHVSHGFSVFALLLPFYFPLYLLSVSPFLHSQE